jgi:hypothetical protein
MNTATLYSDIAVIHGNTPTNPASDAPIPNVTSNAGNAQQISVPVLVNRLNDGNIVCRHSDVSGLFDTVNTLHVIARVGNDLR